MENTYKLCLIGGFSLVAHAGCGRGVSSTLEITHGDRERADAGGAHASMPTNDAAAPSPRPLTTPTSSPSAAGPGDPVDAPPGEPDGDRALDAGTAGASPTAPSGTVPTLTSPPTPSVPSAEPSSPSTASIHDAGTAPGSPESGPPPVSPSKPERDVGNAPPLCGPSDPFATPKPIEGLPAGSLRLRLTDDELTAYFAMLTDDSGWELAWAKRTDRDGAFGEYERLFVNTEWYEFSPSVVDGELELFAESNRTGAFHIFRFDRTSRVDNFGNAELLIGTSPLDDPINAEGGPFITPDGSALYFHATWGSNIGRLYRAQRIDDEFPTAQDMMLRVGEGGEAFPVVSRDELTLYFSSFQVGGDDNDIWMATRSASSDPATGFGNPVVITELRSAYTDVASWVSSDGCRLYFSRSGTPFTGDSVAYVAERNPSR